MRVTAVKPSLHDPRAAVVKEAESWIGTPFHHAARVKGAGIDCLMLPLNPFPGEPLKEVRHRHDSHRGLEHRRISEDRQQRDHPAMAPAHDADP